MNITLTLITLSILVYLLFFQIKIWKWRCFISPGFYFAALWILGVIGSKIFTDLDIVPLAFPHYLDELNVYVAFTGLCFLGLTKKGRKKINTDTIFLRFIPSYNIFLYAGLFLVLVALYAFVSAGANFNMGENRQAMHDTVESQSVLVGYAQSISSIFSICAGYAWGLIFVEKKKATLAQKMILLLPMLSGLIFSIYLGGRIDLIFSVVKYIIGFILAVPLLPAKKVRKKILLLGILCMFCVSIFISAVASQRQEHYGGDNEQFKLVTDGKLYMKVIYGPMEYMVSSYLGYQYRRDDFVDLNNLGYGSYTFNGFINWTLPFAGRIGLENFSIANQFDIYHPSQESYDFERIFFYTTHSSYIPIVQDFGTKGAFVLIFILTYLAHYFFIKIQQRQMIRYSSSLLMFLLFLFYWIKSNFYGFLMIPITMTTLYGLLVLDLLNYLFKRKKIIK